MAAAPLTVVDDLKPPEARMADPSIVQRARDIGEITVGLWTAAASEIADRVSSWRTSAPELVFNLCIDTLNKHLSKYL